MLKILIADTAEEGTPVYIIEVTDRTGQERELLPQAFFSERAAVDYIKALYSTYNIEKSPWSPTTYMVLSTSDCYYAYIKQLTIGE